MFTDPIDYTNSISELIGFQKEIVKEGTTVEDLKKRYADGVLIWVFTADKFDEGIYRLLLEYQDEFRYLEIPKPGLSFHDGLMECLSVAVKMITSPVCIYVITSEIIIPSKALRCMTKNLIEALIDKGCQLTVVSYPSGRQRIKEHIFSTNPEALEKYERQEEEYIKNNYQYEKLLFKMCKEDVAKILREHGVGEAVIQEIERDVRYEKYLR